MFAAVEPVVHEHVGVGEIRAPVADGDLEIARFDPVAVAGVGRGFQVHRHPRLGKVRLHGKADRAPCRVAVRQRKGHRLAGKAKRLERRFRRFDVPLRRRDRRVIAPHAAWDRGVHRLSLTQHDAVDDARAVNRCDHRLARLDIVEGRLGVVEVKIGHQQAGIGFNLDAIDRCDGFGLIYRQAFGNVDVAGLQRQTAGRSVGDDPHLNRLQRRRVACIVRVRHHRDRLALFPCGKLERTRTGGVGRQPALRQIAVLFICHDSRVHDGRPAVGQRVQEGGKRLGQSKAHGGGIDGFDRQTGRKRLGRALRQFHQTLERELDGCGINRRSVGKHVAGLQLEFPDLAVVADRPAVGQLARDGRLALAVLHLIGDQTLIGRIGDGHVVVVDRDAGVDRLRISSLADHQRIDGGFGMDGRGHDGKGDKGREGQVFHGYLEVGGMAVGSAFVMILSPKCDSSNNQLNLETIVTFLSNRP